MILVAHQAPDFKTNYVDKNNVIHTQKSFHEYRDNHAAILFFYPLNFTFVCPSELIALSNSMGAFQERGIKVMAVSIDSEYSHLAWKKTPVTEGGIGPVQFDLAADTSHQITQMYGVEHFRNRVALRATFIIDNQGIVRSQFINDLPIGRNIAEILRTCDAIAHHQQYGEVCPVNWHQGKQAMTPSQEGVRHYLTTALGELA
jgi:peroxiredoxin (alkyl hydroperoxide reductase subunit C)